MDDVEKILEGLSQEDRLKLLESLIQGATKAREESLSIEDRLERLEQVVLGGQQVGTLGAKVVRMLCMPGGSAQVGGGIGCCGCNC
jgi:hypothetical protein